MYLLVGWLVPRIIHHTDGTARHQTVYFPLYPHRKKQIIYNLQTVFNLLPNLNVEELVKCVVVSRVPYRVVWLLDGCG